MNQKHHKFRARYASKCKSCDIEIEEGDVVAYSLYEPGQVICQDCIEEEGGE